MKELSVTINTERLYKEIDAITFKKVDASMVEVSDRAQNAVSSDRSESLDKGIINCYIQNREATLRIRLAFCLKVDEVASVSNNIRDSYSYTLLVPDTLPGVVAEGLVEKMHQYILRGTLHDWYIGQGVASPFSEEGLEQMLSGMVGLMRSGSVKRPLQPFGPRN